MSVNVSPSEVAAPATLPASIRASGALKLVVVHTDSGSAAEDIAEGGPLRVRFPRIRDERLEAILINTAGGIVGGDRLEFRIEAREDASLGITSQAAEKIYRSNGLTSRISVSRKAEAGSELFWLPQETILFDHARVERAIEAEVSSGASLAICEAVVFGRDAMGEKVTRGLWRDRWRIRRDGKLILRILAEDSITLRSAVLSALEAAGTPPPRAYSL
ncbi:MAG: urease accessory protein UreD [Rhizobiales bacterium]|nr:urease accessory protein UreD [Hyphomicrobiales bacterium]